LFIPAKEPLLMNTDPEHSGETLADQAIDWLVLLRSGSVSAETRREFEHWLQQDSAHQSAFAEAEALWGSAAKVLKKTQSVNVTPQRLSAVRKRRTAWNRELAMAASLLLGVWMSWSSLADWMLSDYSTAVGEQKEVVLADGSTVFLNTDSAISLDLSRGLRRVVLLKGQAEFTVAKDAGRPFEVVAGNTTVRALGTVFEVFEQASGAVEVTVSEHAVGVSLPGKSGQEPVRVEEGERLHYAGHGELNRAEPVNLNQIDAWQRGKLIFRDQPLAEVVAELNRYSKAKIVLKGDDIGQLRVSGVFPIDDTAVLGALENAFPIRSTRLGPWLVILHS
jgi:transmembrane sensor